MKDELRSDGKPRLPPGQRLTDRFPVLQKGSIPHVDRETYKLTIEGEVENPITLKLEELQKIRDIEIVEDIHCVTTWSKFETKWGGLSFKKIIELVKPKETAQFVEFLCADGGFTTTVPIEAIKKNNTLMALSYEGEPITDKHGGPVRGLIPDLYFYKSAKWVVKITFLKDDKPGYWERGGYSNKADPWKQQRYSRDD
jgi:DMSO/TMAO reductase YedYZ molybdopterin-dependent catalytic subunit